MAHYGVWIGAALLVAVTTCAVLLGAKAARSVAQFRDEHHENFVGREKR